MRADARIFIFICLLFLIGNVWAADRSIISTSRDSITANGIDQSVLTVLVQNDLGSVNGAEVDFTIDNPDYGTLNPPTVVTGSDGIATSTFNVNKKSGIAVITAEINYYEGATPITIIKTVSQNIDERIFSVTITPSTGTVGETIPFTVSITDQSGQPVDDLGGDVPVGFSVSCTMPNDCGFVTPDGNSHSYSSTFDSNGHVEGQLQLGTKISGEATTIVMSPILDIGQQVLLIQTNPSDAAVLSAEISPTTLDAPLAVPVNTGIFTITYKLTDKFGNPVANKPIQISTTDDEKMSVITNAFGQTPSLSYGPKSWVHDVIITANVENPSITKEIKVAFTNAEPQDMTLVVTPLSMGSQEYETGSKANVVVRVLDAYGTPVRGQDIAFSLESTSYSPGAVSVADPSLSSYSGTTDAEGKVTTEFIPGKFSGVIRSEGSCILKATWTKNPSTHISKSVTLTWTNRPYVNIDTSVNPQTVAKNSVFDVTINVAVNGKTPPPAPLTIMLDQDCSANMPLSEAIAKATDFVNSMDSSAAQIGVQTFGYGDKPSPSMDVTSNFPDLTTFLGTLKKGDSPNAMENSIKASFDELIAHATGEHEDDVKVLILISTGRSNVNNQEGSTTLKTMASENEIYVFPICYSSSCTGGQGPEEMAALAAATGGTFYTASDADELAKAFDAIRERIRILAGANTAMTVSFEKIIIDGTEYSGNEVYEYVPIGPFVARTTDINQVNLEGRTSIIWPDQNQTVEDQTLQWPYLNFNVGSIDLTESWSTTFRLKALKNGTFNIFGPGSEILLNNKHVPLPNIPIVVLPEADGEGFHTGSLNLASLRTDPSGSFTDFISLHWNTQYTSNEQTNFAIEYVSYRLNDGPWHQFDIKTIPAGNSVQPSSAVFDIRALPSGSYDFSVHAKAKDTDDVYLYLNDVDVGSAESQNTHLKLQ